VQLSALAVRPEVGIVEGRWFEPGTSEIVVGQSAAAQFAGLELGRQPRWGESSWKVVGIFEADGSLSESEIWCDASVLQPAYRRGETFQAVYARLRSANEFDRFKDALTADPRLDVKVVRESDYFAEQSVAIEALITTLGTLIAGLMGIGAVFGALNTMYAAVATRTREIATLRALGFGALPVVSSVLTEAMFLALVGGIVGAVVAYAGFNGFQTSTMNWQSFSQVAFAFAVTPSLVARGVVYALVMGFLGGFFPAVRAARMPITAALREL
jgi:putative ABC transport system permease protein